MSHELRAALIATIQSIFPVLNLTGVVSLTGDEISIIMLAINNAVTLLFLILSKQAPVTPTP